MAPKLQVIITSTRPGRVGDDVGTWIAGVARDDGRFDVDLIDLQGIGLPFMDEPRHPRLRQYEHEHTKAWSALVDPADAFLFVIPEYNFGAPPALVNAIDFLFHEWNYKPAGLVSYGGVSAGLRSSQALRPILSAVKVVPLPEAVSIPFIQQHLDDEGRVVANEQMEQGATAMLTELARWEQALRGMRRGEPTEPA